MALGSTQPPTEMSTRNISWVLRRPVRRANNLATFMCQLSWNMGASTFWNPQGLSRAVQGLLYLFTGLYCTCMILANWLWQAFAKEWCLTIKFNGTY